MHFFNRARGVVITGNVTMNAYSSAPAGDQEIREGFDILSESITPSAFYGSTGSELGKDLGCLHGTRLGVQDHIFRWLDNPEGEVAMWMYGPAGIGKTAIAQTVAKLCAERGQLSAAFLFFRSDEGRNSGQHLVPTLAFEMVQQIPHTRRAVCTPISSNPRIFSFPLERQIRTIILPAILEPFPSWRVTPIRPMLFIIDGLDECADIGTQKSIIRSFISLLAATVTTVRHKILIVSRPESHIVSTFLTHDIRPHVHHLCLDEWESIVDIEIFLRSELKAVQETHPLKSYLDAQWPSEGSVQKLLHKSFESFAYATAAVRYISSHDRHPDTSLDNLLSLSPHSTCEAHSELDSLYRHILESLDEQTRHTVLMVLCIDGFRFYVDIETFGYILGKETSVIELAMIKMSSVIRFQRHQLYYYHISFIDFLRDKQRSGSLYLYSPSVAIAAATTLMSRVFEEPPSTRHRNYLISGSMLPYICDFAVDMQMHMLNGFIATQLPKKYPACPNPFLGSFVSCMERGSQLAHHSETLQLLYLQAIEHLATWLRSQFGPDIFTLDIILDICFMPTFMPRSYLARKPWDLFFDLVRRSNDTWSTIRRLLPGNETWNIFNSLVDLYLDLPQDTRLEDIQEHLIIAADEPVPCTIFPLTTILIRFLRSEPTYNQVCHALEQIVSEATSASSAQMTTENLISFHLSQDSCKSKQSEPAIHLIGCTSCLLSDFSVPNAENMALYTPLARAMDMYIRQTHAQQDLPYISEKVKRLYCGPGVVDPDHSE